MPFVKLDCGILDSTLWPDRVARELFITALLMAEPYETIEPEPQIAVRGLNETGFIVPPGWYGIVRAAGIGIVRRAGIDPNEGLDALERLGAPDPESRTPRFDGRRLVRVNGGFLALNFDLYRTRDYTSAERSRRYREKKLASRVTDTASRVTERDITQAEAEAEAEASTTMGVSPEADNGKSKPIEVATVARIALHYLNERAGTKFREVPGHLTLIMARLKSPGVTIEGVKQMIDRQAALWKGKEQEQYLRPSTLFGKMKFDGYYDARECSVPRSPTEIQGLQKEKRQLEDEISVRTVEESQPQRTRLAEVKRQLAL